MNMENIYNGELSNEYHGEEQKKGGNYQESKQKGIRGQQQRGEKPPFLSDVGPINTIPMIGNESNNMENQAQQQGGQIPPHLFGQTQFKDDLVPVYAIPTVPWQHESVQGVQQGQGWGMEQLQSGKSQGMGQLHHGQEIGQWQQWVGHPQVCMPCMCCKARQRYYW